MRNQDLRFYNSSLHDEILVGGIRPQFFIFDFYLSDVKLTNLLSFLAFHNRNVNIGLRAYCIVAEVHHDPNLQRRNGNT